MAIIQSHSMRLSHGIFLAAVITLAILAVSNIYINGVSRSAAERYQRILKLQKLFVDVLSKENSALGDSEPIIALLDAEARLISEIELEPQYLSSLLLKERGQIFRKLLETTSENQKFYSDIRRTLPELVNSVSYIHTHHIVNLKNVIRRGKSVRDYDVGPEFQRSQVHSAPELDIISAAVDVQSHLLEVVSVFSEMQLGGRHDDMERVFQKRMKHFQEMVNLFDDYTLDAQDGLLVEELLLTGKKFSRAFSELLKNNRKIDLLHNKLLENKQTVSEMFEVAILHLKASNEKLEWQLKLVQNSSTAMSIVLACWLLYYGIKLAKDFARTVAEARKIQVDLNYRIPLQSCGYQEFDFIYASLNTLASTAGEQVRSLERMQGELSKRVQERTAELVHMNSMLKNEIADRIQAEERRKVLEAKLSQAQKMEAIGTLAGGVAHDLNNILSGVVTYPELILLDMDKDDPLYTPIQSIKQSGEKAASIVQDLLTLGRRGVAVSEVVDLLSIIAEYLNSPEFRTLQRTHPNIEFKSELSDTTCNVKGSRLHLQKAVMNLVTNGMEAMPDGGLLTLTAKSVYLDTALKGYATVCEGEYVSLAVEDSGIGMSQEIIEKIFEPFFSQKSMGRSGTGLGMTVVYSTVKDHGGYIDIESIPGKGSVITLFLPLTREDEILPVTGVEFSALMGESEHILVVDDVFEQRQLASMMLKRLNYTVATAAGGAEAVAYMKNNEVDIVLLDMIMSPDMDGLDTFMAIQACAPDARVILVSGYSENSRVQKAQTLGAGRYIRKPYSVETLGVVLRESMQSKR